MAAGDYTVSTGPVVSGDAWLFTGTAEVDDTLRAFDIFPNGYIVSGTFNISGYDDAVAVEVNENEDASGTTDNGNVALQGNLAATNTCRWSCLVKGL